MVEASIDLTSSTFPPGLSENRLQEITPHSLGHFDTLNCVKKKKQFCEKNFVVFVNMCYTWENNDFVA